MELLKSELLLQMHHIQISKVEIVQNIDGLHGSCQFGQQFLLQLSPLLLQHLGSQTLTWVS